MTISPTPQSTAWHAVRAALNVKNWGLFAARRYAERHGAGAYFTLARVLAKAEFRGVPALSARPAGMMGYASRMTGEKQCLN